MHLAADRLLGGHAIGTLELIEDVRVCGQRAATGSQANRTNFLWDVNGALPQIALERDGNNNLLRRYVHGMRRISQTSGNNTSFPRRSLFARSRKVGVG